MPKSPLATLPNGPAPLRPNTIGTIIAKQPQFSQLNTHLNLLGIHTLENTLFAPIDVAFDRLSPNAQRLLLGPNYFNRAMMGFTLAGLLVPTKIPADSMKLDHQYDVPTLAGVSLQVARMGKANNSNSNSNSDNIHVEDAHVVGEPILTQNGIIYQSTNFERMVDDLFHFSSNIKPNQTVII
ncbi:hypothetical protein BDF19DRAFT_440095 [Syncephalis fuscata]|nr:hypothetical protein BDF19DRAFT_440095 [Syncephalis fuscata]